MKGALNRSSVGDGRQMSVLGGATSLKWEDTVAELRSPLESTKCQSLCAAMMLKVLLQL
jgi:hypothetical protein